MKYLLIIISILLFYSPLFGQSGKPQTIIIPTGSLGEMSESRIKILEKTLESKLDDHLAIVPKELFEEAQEQAFQEMDSDECTEDQCILMIKEILQIENAFKMDLIVGTDYPDVPLLFIDPIRQYSKKNIKNYAKKLNVPLSYFYKDSFGSISKKFFKKKMAFPTIVGIEGETYIFRFNGIDDEILAEMKRLL